VTDVRIRTIKPEWLEDEPLAMCGSLARLLSVALIVMADDHGRGRATEVVMAAKVFTYEPDPIGCLREALAKLESIKFVQLYKVRGQRYYWIRNWSKHQKVDRPGQPRFPGPDEADSDDGEPTPPAPESPSSNTVSRGPREPSRNPSARSTDLDRRTDGPTDQRSADRDRAHTRARDQGHSSNVVPLPNASSRLFPSNLREAEAVFVDHFSKAYLALSYVKWGGDTQATKRASSWLWERIGGDGEKYATWMPILVKAFFGRASVQSGYRNPRLAMKFSDILEDLWQQELIEHPELDDRPPQRLSDNRRCELTWDWIHAETASEQTKAGRELTLDEQMAIATRIRAVAWKAPDAELLKWEAKAS
jgi:hypothetical protein